MQFTPDTIDGGYKRWNLPAQTWSGAEFPEDTIVICYDKDKGEWWARTEVDQCCDRDLDQEQIASIIAEFKLTA